jgi:hypothetical protein
MVAAMAIELEVISKELLHLPTGRLPFNCCRVGAAALPPLTHSLRVSPGSDQLVRSPCRHRVVAALER